MHDDKVQLIINVMHNSYRGHLFNDSYLGHCSMVINCHPKLYSYLFTAAGKRNLLLRLENKQLYYLKKYLLIRTLHACAGPKG